MDETQAAWLRQWHDILDEAFGADPEFDFDEALESPDDDFRMQFMTWDLSDEQLMRCFQILPGGEPLGQRAIEMRALLRGEQRTISEAEAKEMFQEGLNRYARFSEDGDLKKPFQVKHVARDDVMNETMNTESLGIIFEDAGLPLGEEASSVSEFLTETLYRLASYYEVVDYIKWPLYEDPDGIEPHEPIAKLVMGGQYYAMLDENGPVLFVVTE